MKPFYTKILNDDIAYFYAIFFFLLLLSTFTISCIGFFLGIRISPYHFPLSFLTSAILFLYNVKKIVKISVAFLHLAIITLLLFAVFFICINLLDTSYDGLWYHQPAIIRLAEGWNPIYNPFYTITQYDKSNYLWIQHYPKASWTIAACIYKMTGFVESGKMINFFVVNAVFFYSYSLFTKLFKGNLFYTLSFSILISLNPVVTSQLFSDYLDGIISGILCLILLSLLNMQFPNERFRKWNWFILFGSIIIITNLKFTGLYIAGIMIAFFSIYWWWKKEPFAVIFKKYFLIGVFSIVSLFLFGFNPYFTNLKHKGHIFYPLNIKENYSILKSNEPESLNDKNNISQFFISLFSEADNEIHTKKINWKNPLTISKKDIRAYASTDIRLGGRGPLFLLALLFSLLACLLAFSKLKKECKALLIISITAIFISAILVPMGWWARYTPQFFLVPVIATAFSVYSFSNQKTGLSKYFPVCVIIILLANLIFIAAPNLAANRIKTQLIRNEMAVLKLRKKPILINFNKTEFQALRTRLKEAQISFTDCDTLKTNIKELRSIYNLYGYGPFYNIGE